MSRDDTRAIGAEGSALHGTAMTAQDGDLACGRSIPDAGGLVI
jgi:hypothetical protein